MSQEYPTYQSETLVEPEEYTSNDNQTSSSMPPMRYAGYVKRLGADMLNIALLILVGILLYFPILIWCFESQTSFPAMIFCVLLEFLICFLYVRYGGTPGYRLLKLRVVNRNMNDLSWGAALKRQYFHLLFLFISLLQLQLAIQNRPLDTYPWGFNYLWLFREFFWEELSLLFRINKFYIPHFLMSYGGIYTYLIQIAGVFVLLDLLVIFLNSKKRAIRDFFAESYVVPQQSMVDARQTGEKVTLGKDYYANTLLIGMTSLFFFSAFIVLYTNRAAIEAQHYYNQGISYLQNDEDEKAIGSFSKAIETNPQSPDTYARRGYIYLTRMEYDNAIDDFSEAIELDPQDHQNYLYRAYASEGKGKINSAELDIFIAVSICQKDQKIAFDEGLAYMKDKEYDKAIDHFTKILEITPGNAFAYYYRGHAYYFQGKDDEAIRDYDSAIRNNPVYADAYFNRGVVYIEEKGNYQEGIRDCTKVIEINPDDKLVYNLRGEAYTYQGEYEKAIEDYTTGIAKDPANAKIYYNRGVTYGKKGEYDKAIADYTKTIQRAPNFLDAYNNRGIMYEEQKEYDKALADFNTILSKKPSALAYHKRGDIHYYQGKYEKAIEDYTRAISKNSEYALTYYRRGIVYSMGEEDNDKAIEDYTKAITLDSEIWQARYNRGVIYIEEEEYDKAIDDFTELTVRNPEEVEAYRLLGIVYEYSGRTDEAMKAYKTFIRKAPSDHPRINEVREDLKKLED